MEPDATLIEANETTLTAGGPDRADVIGTKIWESAWIQYGDAGA